VISTIALQARLPGLFDLCFREGTPLADAATKAWLDGVRGELGLGGGGGGGGGDGRGADALTAAVDEARKLLSEAKGADAVARLARESERPAGRRSWFRAQLALAGVCFDMNRLGLALSILEGLEGEVGRYQLEEWEPELAGQLWGRLYETYKRSRPKPSPDDARRLHELFGRFGRLDPKAALALDTAGGAGGGA
jgi:type VI secretion system protein VasJ